MRVEELAEAVWYGAGPGARAARLAIAPLAALFGAGVAARGRLYDAGVLASHPIPLPTVSVGNLTVGGTGKTPVAAWVVAELRRRGLYPGVVLRGVGGDEAHVHALLNPGAPVIADPDRVRGASRAAAAGADAVVLDDAFQHRRARRDVDLVLVAAERFDGLARLLPAGAYREPLAALGRATAVVVTRKTATVEAAEAVTDRLRLVVRAGAPVTVAHLAASSVTRWGGSTADLRSVDALAGARVLAVAGVGAPEAFAEQLRAAGARVVLARYPDHHAYTVADAGALATRAREVDLVITTLKDAVKLGPLWRDSGRALWYVTQRVRMGAGADALAAVLDALAAASHRTPAPIAPPTASPGRDF